jgi:hypothetical protein
MIGVKVKAKCRRASNKELLKLYIDDKYLVPAFLSYIILFYPILSGIVFKKKLT